MKNTEFEKYISGDFSKYAAEFVRSTGQWSDSSPFEVKMEGLNVQMNQVVEECLEMLGAYGSDLTETLDGYIDLLFTWVNFESMIASIQADIANDVNLVKEFEDKLNAKTFLVLENIVPVAFKLNLSDIGEEKLIAAAKMIIENNRLKYTTDLELAKSWEIDNSDGLETELKETVVDGVSYYALLDKEGKVRKHKNFQKVKLEEILGGV